MNQIYKFSDPTSGFTHYILSTDIKKNLKYLDYLYRNFIKNPTEGKQVNSTLVKYLWTSKKPFTEISMELVFESEDRTKAEQKLFELKVETHQTPIKDTTEALAVPQEELVSEKPTDGGVVSDTELSVPTPKKRGRKKKVVQEDVVA